ncbi:MAG TPA: 50S ribosomal protein L4 [Gemmatimonadales bacterium]
MPEALHFTASAERKGSYALPAEYDGTVNRAALYLAIRAYRNNQRHGTHSTKGRAEVSGGNQKPWKQKGTGRARQGSTRAPHWRHGGIAFGPKPRSYRTDIPRKVRQLARASALNARAAEGAIHVIEALDFSSPKTKQLADLLTKLALSTRKVLILTAENRPMVYLSARNLQAVRVLRYGEAAAYDIVWADALLIEEAALGGHVIAGSVKAKAAPKAKKKAAGRAVAKTAARAKTAAKKPAAKKATKPAKAKKKGGDNA